MNRRSFLRSIVAAVALAPVLAGCDQSGVTVLATAATNNPNYQVDELFEHDGIKVYRFYDSNHYVYFTDARGSVNWSNSVHKGKTTVEVPMQNSVEQ